MGLPRQRSLKSPYALHFYKKEDAIKKIAGVYCTMCDARIKATPDYFAMAVHATTKHSDRIVAEHMKHYAELVEATRRRRPSEVPLVKRPKYSPTPDVEPPAAEPRDKQDNRGRRVDHQAPDAPVPAEVTQPVQQTPLDGTGLSGSPEAESSTLRSYQTQTGQTGSPAPIEQPGHPSAPLSGDRELEMDLAIARWVVEDKVPLKQALSPSFRRLMTMSDRFAGLPFPDRGRLLQAIYVLYDREIVP